MAGYSDYSKSNNAVRAEKEGKFPLTKATKILATELNITQKKAREVLLNVGHCEYHHTSKNYNITNYYDIKEIIENQKAYEQITHILGLNYLEKIQESRVKVAWDLQSEKCKEYLSRRPNDSVVVFSDDREAIARIAPANEVDFILENWLNAENYL